MRNPTAPASTPSETTQAANTGRGEQPSTSGSDEASRVIYIGQLPHGFFEEQLKGVSASGFLGILAPLHMIHKSYWTQTKLLQDSSTNLDSSLV